MFRILVIATEKNRGAEETLAERLCVYVRVADTVDVIMRKGEEESVGSCPVNVHIVEQVRTIFGRYPQLLRCGRGIISKMSRNDGDTWVIISDGEENALATAWMSRMLQVPFEITYDALNEDVMPAKLSQAFLSAGNIRVPSRRVKELLMKRYTYRIEPTVLPLPLDDIPKDTRHIHEHLVIGYISDEPSCEDLVRAWRHIVNRYPDMRLFVMTESVQNIFPEVHVMAIAHRLGLQESVRTVSFLERERINELYNTASMFLHVPTNVPYGRRLMRACLSRIPTITTDVGVVGDILTENHVLVCRVGDSACVAKQALFMLNNPMIKESIGEKRPKITYDGDILLYTDILRSLWASVSHT